MIVKKTIVNYGDLFVIIGHEHSCIKSKPNQRKFQPNRSKSERFGNSFE